MLGGFGRSGTDLRMRNIRIGDKSVIGFSGDATFPNVEVDEMLTVKGEIDVSGNITMNNSNITNLADPVGPLDAVNKQYVDAFRAVGDIKHSAQSNDHNGWLICDGRSLTTTVYDQLYDVIGTSFGTDGVGTFKLPDCRSRVMGAIGQGLLLSNREMGDAVGTETFTLTANELPAHTHTGTTNASGSHTHTVNDPGHTHTQTTINDDFNNSGANPPGFTADSAGSMTWNNISTSTTGITLNGVGDHTHTFTTNSTGSGNAFPMFQPTLFIGNVFIFANV
jgi:microcystin-dependent protein